MQTNNHFSRWYSLDSALSSEKPCQTQTIEEVYRLILSEAFENFEYKDLPVITTSGVFGNFLDPTEIKEFSWYFGFSLSLPKDNERDLEKLKVSLMGDKKLNISLAFTDIEAGLVNALIKERFLDTDIYCQHTDALKYYLSKHYPHVEILGYPSSFTNLIILCSDPTAFYIDRCGDFNALQEYASIF